MYRLIVLIMLGNMLNNRLIAQIGKPIVVQESDSIRLEYTLVNEADSTYARKMYKHDTLIESLFLRNRMRVGEYREYYDNGKLLGEGHFDSTGNYTGVWKRYFKNGQLVSERTYHLGGLKGQTTFYYQNGHKKAAGEYDFERYELLVSGRSMDNLIESRVGKWQYFHENGKLESEGHYWFDEILLQTPEERLGETENIEFGDLTRPWKVDLKHGVWKYYTPDGKLKKTENYDKGELLEVNYAK